MEEIRDHGDLGEFVLQYGDAIKSRYGNSVDVDDNRVIFSFLAFMAERRGYTFQPARTHVESFAPDVGPSGW